MKTKGLLLAVLFIAVPLALFMCAADGTDAASGTDIRVFVETDDGVFEETYVDSANSVEEIVNGALSNLNMEIVYDRNGRITSVGGITAAEGEFWNIHQWMPLGTHDWGSMGYDKRSDSFVISNASYCLHRSGQTQIGNQPVYDKPDFKPVSTGYIFIRFDYDYDTPIPEVQDAFDADVRQKGFWLKGQGTNMGEVIMNAMAENGFEADFGIGQGVIGDNDVQYWLNSFFGLKDESLEGGAWKYWAQFCYVDDRWGYNQYTLGYYDPAVYKYASCIRTIGEMDLDPGQFNLPDVDRDPIVPMKSSLSVTFELDGVRIGNEVSVRYGSVVDPRKIPTVTVPEGKVFSGWAGITEPIKKDTVFKGTFYDRTDELTVRYFDETGTVLLYTEFVMKGQPATYDGIPVKKDDKAATYTFDRWDGDLSCITADTDVKAVYKATPKEYPVKFYDYDSRLLFTRMVEYGKDLTDMPDDPVRPMTVDKVFSFRGWSVSTSKFIEADFTNITDLRTAYASYTYEIREYNITFMHGAHRVSVIPMEYDSVIGETVPMTIFEDGYALMYSDASLKTEINAYYTVYGDATVYLKKVPGRYTYMDNGGTEQRSVIVIDLTAEDVSHLEIADGAVQVGDVSQLFKDRNVYLSDTVLRLLNERYPGKLMELGFTRGHMLFDAATVLPLTEDTGMTAVLEKGPSTALRITASLKKVNSDGLYTAMIRIDGMNTGDLTEYGIDAYLSIPFREDSKPNTAVAWSANASTGKLTVLDSEVKNGSQVFRMGVVPYFATGTEKPRQDAVRSDVICPYGDVVYKKYGSDNSTYRCVLESMALDNKGGVLYIPCAFEGYPLREIGDGAFRSVIDAYSIVIPDTVQTFWWGAVAGTQFTDIYFLGNAPSFEGERPDGLTVHCAQGTTGWNTDTDEVLHIMTYAKDGYSFRYYCIDGEITVCEYVSGKDVDIPVTINVNGNDCIVRNIGCEAFMNADLEYVRLPAGITDIQTRAFMYSDVKFMTWSDDIDLKHIWDEAFRGCKYMRTVSLPEGLLFIGFESFRQCTMIYSVNIPDSVRMLKDGAFYVCEKLGDVTIGKNITAIPDWCFSYCVMLDNVELPESVTSVGSNAFLKCTQLSFIDLNKVQSIGRDSFRLCTSLEAVILGPEFRDIAIGSFAEDTVLEEIEAHCPQPAGLGRAFVVNESEGEVIPENITFFVKGSMTDEWDIPCETLVEEDDLKQKPSNHLGWVLGGMVIFFIIAGIYSFRLKSR